jgi:hypothetical protein
MEEVAMAVIETRVVTGGVDTYADTQVAAALDGVGGLLGTESFPVSAAGYGQLLAWLASHGTVVKSVSRAPARMGRAWPAPWPRRG